jgi:D-amino peptidase
VRVLVFGDMEGVAGITKWQQTDAGEPLYEEGRKLYTEEINAAVGGARAGGATEIVVLDCHGAGKGYTFNSLLPELLDPDCDFVVQNEWTEYTAFLEQGCDAALLVAMHARAGTPRGVLSHTVSGKDYRGLWFNGIPVGEIGINAALCGAWGCPVVLVTGDRATCQEAHELLGRDVETVAVKEGLGRFSARHVPPVRARRLIEDGARRALEKRGAVKPFEPGSPCEVAVEFSSPDLVEPYCYRPGVEVTGPLRVVSRAEDWWTAWRQFYF